MNPTPSTDIEVLAVNAVDYDNLVKRLNNELGWGIGPVLLCQEAAQAILALTARNRELEWLRERVARIALRGSNGGHDNAVVSIHDATDAVHAARALTAKPDGE